MTEPGEELCKTNQSRFVVALCMDTVYQEVDLLISAYRLVDAHGDGSRRGFAADCSSCYTS